MQRTTGFLFLAFCFIATVHSGGQYTACSKGPECFPGGEVPEGLSPKHRDYYCCPERYSTVRLKSRRKIGVTSCRCKWTPEIGRDIIRWADRPNVPPRRRVQTPRPSVVVRIKRKFTFCCFGSGRNRRNQTFSRAEYMPYDRDKAKFIGCRCVHLAVPTPDPHAADVVPPLPPALRCQPPWLSNVTFCCYGSRGLVTENDAANNVTRCTCTNEVYGTRCDVTTTTVADTTDPCLRNCDSRTSKGPCTDSNQASSCCPDSSATPQGNVTSCTCNTELCDTGAESFAWRLGGRFTDVVNSPMDTFTPSSASDLADILFEMLFSGSVMSHGLTSLRITVRVFALAHSLRNDIYWVPKTAIQGQGVQWLAGEKLFDLYIADHIAALAESTRDFQSLVNEISASAASTGLNISDQQT
ncbi:hypothetical protein ACOMHN_012358 [Nucella lapillus]